MNSLSLKKHKRFYSKLRLIDTSLPLDEIPNEYFYIVKQKDLAEITISRRSTVVELVKYMSLVGIGSSIVELPNDFSILIKFNDLEDYLLS
jgi:hypothetical protein